MSCRRDDVAVCPRCGMRLLFPFSDGIECHGRCPKHGLVFWTLSDDALAAQEEEPRALRTVAEMANALQSHVSTAAWVREEGKVLRPKRGIRA